MRKQRKPLLQPIPSSVATSRPRTAARAAGRSESASPRPRAASDRSAPFSPSSAIHAQQHEGSVHDTSLSARFVPVFENPARSGPASPPAISWQSVSHPARDTPPSIAHHLLWWLRAPLAGPSSKARSSSEQFSHRREISFCRAACWAASVARPSFARSKDKSQAGSARPAPPPTSRVRPLPGWAVPEIKLKLSTLGRPRETPNRSRCPATRALHIGHAVELSSDRDAFR